MYLHFAFLPTNISTTAAWSESVEYVGSWAFPHCTDIYLSSKTAIYTSSEYDNLHYIDKEEKKEGTFSKILKNIF